MADRPMSDRRPRAAAFEGLDALAAAAHTVRPGKSPRGAGKGVAALLAGGTAAGRLQAAESVARDAGAPLLRVDLAAVVSKYIGETEKNLDALFARAASSQAILYFDEAEALFGTRSDTRDAQDRYANLEVSYLLQKIEEHEGLMILASNRREDIDPVFQKRLQYFARTP